VLAEATIRAIQAASEAVGNVYGRCAQALGRAWDRMFSENGDGANSPELKPTEPTQPDENNLDKIKGNKAADEVAREAGYDDAHDAKKGRGDSRVNIYNDKTTGQKWIWDGKKGSGKEQL
jgi:hypothetical protein